MLIPIVSFALNDSKDQKTLAQLLGSNAPFLVHHVIDLIDHFIFKLLFYNSFLK